MPVACMEFEVGFLVVMVGLYLANNLSLEFSLDFKLLLLTAPHRQKALRHPGGRLSLFLAIL